MSQLLKDTQGIVYTIASFKDIKGNPAVVDGAPVWENLTPEIVSIVPSEDGMNCEVRAIGPLGAYQVKATADALIGEGTVELTGIADGEVIAGQAVTMEMVAGVPFEL